MPAVEDGVVGPLMVGMAGGPAPIEDDEGVGSYIVGEATTTAVAVGTAAPVPRPVPTKRDGVDG